MGEITISKYNIAGIIIEYNGFVDKGIENDMQPYLCDEQPNPDVVINGALCDKVIKAEGNIKENNNYRYWDITEDKYIFYDYDAKADICFMKVTSDKDWKNIDIQFFDIKKHLNASDDYFVFNALRDIFKYICLKHSGVVLHSSAIALDNKGIAFSAHSGVGKSTHTSMWQTMFPEKVDIINDDTPAIMIQDGQAIMYGTPFCGTSGINLNTNVPLKAIVFLQRGEENTIEEIPAADAIRRLLEQIKRPPVGKIMEEIYFMIGQLLQAVPVYLLTCTISEDAVKVVKNKLNI